MTPSSIYPQELCALLQSLNQPEKLLSVVLRNSILQTSAIRGLVFDREQIIHAVGYQKQADKVTAWNALSGLLVECYGVVLSAEPCFAAPLRDRGSFQSERCAAGVLAGETGNFAVVGIEKDSPLTEAELAAFESWLQLASMPAAVSFSNDRMRRMMRREPLRWRDLPLHELAELPRLQEIQMLLIGESLRRTNNNKGKAAHVLGISREGLRRKLLRERDAEAA